MVKINVSKRDIEAALGLVVLVVGIGLFSVPAALVALGALLLADVVFDKT